MDVINFSGGGPQTDPASDALVEAVRNVVAAGVVPVISAGNDRDDYGLGSAGSPGTAPEAISVAALSNTHVYAPAARRDHARRARAADADPVRARRRPGDPRCLGIVRPDARRREDDRRDERLARSREPLRPARQPRRRPLAAAAAGSLRGSDRARLARHLHVRAQGRAGRGPPAASGSSSSTTGPARRTGSRPSCAVPGGMVADLDGHALAAYLTGNGGRAARPDRAHARRRSPPGAAGS